MKLLKILRQIRQNLIATFQTIPTYGFGSAMELKQVFTRYLTILVQLRREQPAYAVVKGLIWNAHHIRKSVTCANDVLIGPKARRCFNDASNAMGLDMEYLISVLGISIKANDDTSI